MSAAVSATRSRKFEQNRELMLTGAATLFNRVGVKGGTLADVAEFAGLSLKSVRYYFRRKEDLVVECFQRAFVVYDRIISQAAQAASPRDRVRVVLEEWMALSARVRKGEAPPFLHFGDLRALDDVADLPIGRAYLDMFRRFRRLLLEDGHPPPERDTLNARAHFLISQVLWAVVWTGRYESELLPRLARHMYQVLSQGLLHDPADWAPQPLAGQALVGSGDPHREAFLRAATDLLNEQGYRGASVDRISARLRVTKGAFYHHNEAKDDLVSDCFGRSFDVMCAAQLAAEQAGGRAATRLASAAAHLAQCQLGPQGPLLRPVLLSGMPPALRGPLAQRLDSVSLRFYNCLADGMLEGSVRPVDPWVATQMIIGMVSSVAGLPRWAGGVRAANVAQLYARPLFTGLFAA
ncbi:TetR/AcrR family transcriptional regulator [Eleftheria terrae]|uniref:TetR/AcrR family transcriptional regulator n=1 Tax=Eleftheria terrae TaxID=1597781 RepID=UPI00263BBB65|nr:TetR/AcrR family transcriptional regulator [Eleftheria terrae]WKB51627.1 TetR/AcrR family transcriptional regulator [Eleftheria terrae]